MKWKGSMTGDMSFVSQRWLESVDEDIREDVFRAMERLRQEEGEGFWEIYELIARADPEGLIAMGGAYEYNVEAQAIYGRLEKARSSQDVRRIVDEEFRKAFGVAHGADGAIRIIPNYHPQLSDAEMDSLADAIWHAWVSLQNDGM